ncbi:hypothetical protein MRX96_008028 [Rhipicephalus microplus]
MSLAVDVRKEIAALAKVYDKVLQGRIPRPEKNEIERQSSDRKAIPTGLPLWWPLKKLVAKDTAVATSTPGHHGSNFQSRLLHLRQQAVSDKPEEVTYRNFLIRLTRLWGGGILKLFLFGSPTAMKITATVAAEIVVPNPASTDSTMAIQCASKSSVKSGHTDVMSVWMILNG